jgi:hypothetical protein
MKCKICEKKLSGKSKIICHECHRKKHLIKCNKCGKECSFTPKYFYKLDLITFNCKQCKLNGEGNPNYGNKWSNELKKRVSEIVKSRVDENYRLNCSKGMKGKKVSEESKLKRKNTNELKILNGYIKPEISEETRQKIGYKSSLKFTDEYKQKMRVINEERGVWIPLNKKNDYRFYRDLSNWVGQVITENTIGVDKLKTGKLYDKNNRNKNSYVRDHIFGRKNGFVLGVFPEIIRHPANCQIITHSDNIKKSLKNDDSDIQLVELFDRISNWGKVYFEQLLCVELIEQYNNGKRYDKQKYVNKLKNNKYVKN